MRRTGFREQFGVDKWPLAMVASAGALQDSTGGFHCCSATVTISLLVALLLCIYLQLPLFDMSGHMAGGVLTNLFISNLLRGLAGDMTLGQLLGQMHQQYWQQHGKLIRLNAQLPAHMRIGEVCRTPI